MKCTNKKSISKQQKLRIRKVRQTLFLMMFAIILLLAGSLCVLLIRNAGKEKEAWNYNRSRSISGIDASEGALLSEGIAHNLCVGDDNTSMDGIEELEEGSAALFDIRQKEIPYSKGLYEKKATGCINKYMIALIAYESLDMEEILKIQEEDVVWEGNGKSCGLRTGEKVSVQQLINAVMISSAEDASFTLARAVSGSRKNFVKLMNQKAYELGMTNTQFANITGAEDEDQYSTIYDTYLLFNYFLKHEDLTNIMGISAYTLNSTKSNGDLKQTLLTSKNPYITETFSVPKGVTVLGGTYIGSKIKNDTILLVQNNYGDVFFLMVFQADSEKSMNARIWEMLEKVNS